MEKTHNTEGLGSENISMFFSNSIANKKGFLPRPARFRAWTGGTGREAGSWQGDAIREIAGTANLCRIGSTPGSPSSGAISVVRDPNNGIIDASGGEPLYGNLVFSAAKVVPTAADNRPVNVAIPVILYLGLRA